MIEKIKEILADNLEVEMDEIGDDSHIQEDLGADSLDVMDIMTAIEDVIESLTTPKKIQEYIESKK